MTVFAVLVVTKKIRLEKVDMRTALFSKEQHTYCGLVWK